MADVSGTSTLAGTAGGTVATAAPKPAGVSSKELQDRFLTLLVTQMKNQDPLSPMDNAQLTSQLAQISTVTGIDKVNDTMNSVLSQIRALESMQATTLDGRDVLVPGSRLDLGDSGAVGGFEIKDAADQMLITIKDASGALVREIQMGRTDAGIHRFDWDGLATSGAKAAPGVYSFSVRGMMAGKDIETTALAKGHVAGIVRATDGAQLDLGALGRKPMSEVREIL